MIANIDGNSGLGRQGQAGCIVGQRQPRWADEAWDDFAKRFPPEMRLELKALKAESRSGGKTAAQWAEAMRRAIADAAPADAKIAQALADVLSDMALGMARSA